MTIKIETAKLAKEKNFNYSTEKYYFPKDSRKGYNIFHKDKQFGSDKTVGELYTEGYLQLTFPAPTQSELQKWLREEHKLYITAIPHKSKEDKVRLNWFYSLVDDRNNLDNIFCNADDLGASQQGWHVYEEAVEAGLIEALNKIE